MRKRRIAAALVAGALGTALVPSLPAQAATTYEIILGAEFFGQGVPGFSARPYPGSVRVHDGDTLHFDFPFLTMGPQGVFPQELMAEEVQIGTPRSFFLFDPDDGPKALKANLGVFFNEGEDCGTADNPCVWGPNADVFFPAFNEEAPDLFVRIDAPPGTTLRGATIGSPDVNVNFKVEVVENSEAASTQAELDERAARLMAKDFEDALALHNKMSAKKTWHFNSAGQKVFDVFVGAAAGPIELLASYPRRTKIRRGQRVQFHFMDQVEPHTATFGGAQAREVFNNFLIPACDPDGDDGTLPDVEPTGFDENSGLPICPEGTTLEGDIHDLLPWAVGNGRVTGTGDYENSGLQFPHFPEGTQFDENPDPWTVAFPKASKKGFKFICLLHGGFMGGRVLVR